METPSPTSSTNSGRTLTLFRNGPQNNEYIKTHKNIFLSYVDGANSFQQGHLGDNDTFIVGNLHLNYSKSCQVKSIYLHLKGTEKTTWQKSQARTKSVYSGECTLVDQTNKIWEAFDDAEEVTMLDIPFKVQLPFNLPDAVTTDVGSVKYVLRATVNTKAFFGSQQTSVKVNCPLRKTLTLDNHQVPPFKLSGQTPNGVDYIFLLPPNKSFNIGSYVSIPMRLKFLRPNVGIEKIEVSLRTSMNFQSTTQGEVKRLEQKIMGISVSRSEFLYSKPNTSSHHSECAHTINLFVPKGVQPTYHGRFISITHLININFWGFDSDCRVEESIRIGHIVEKYPRDESPVSPVQQFNNLSNISLSSYSTSSTSQTMPISPQITPPLPPRRLKTPPINKSQYFTNNAPIESTNYQQQKPALPDRPFSHNNNSNSGIGSSSSNTYHQLIKPERSEMRRDPETSTPSKDIETISNPSPISPIDIVSGCSPYPTHLSPPPYRQAMKLQEYK